MDHNEQGHLILTVPEVAALMRCSYQTALQRCRSAQRRFPHTEVVLKRPRLHTPIRINLEGLALASTLTAIQGKKG